jgi:coenzyme F420 hydrogenase subunit alpha
MDDSLGIEIPKAARQLRELLLAAHDVNSHAIHQFLIAADIVPADLMVTAINSVSEIRKNAQYVADMVGGEGIHPSDVRIGGMAQNISEVARKRLYARLRALKPKVDAHVDLIIGLVADKGFPEGLGVTNAASLATHQLYGDRTKFDLDRFTEIMPETWYDDPEVGKKACSTIPLYDGMSVEVGPRARAEVFHGFKGKGVVAQHVTRALEMKTALSKAIDILGELNTSAPVMADYEITGTNKLGIGAIEGPRGMDVHMAQVANGKTQFYSCLVPTTWNIPTMGPATEGFHHDFGPHVIRAYDPCLSCATHVIVVDDEDRSIIKNEMVRI